jgi:hypothetical protein
LVEAEAHALVVLAEGKAAKAGFLWAWIGGLTTEFADGCGDVRYREEDIDAAFWILVVEPAADRSASRPRPGRRRPSGGRSTAATGPTATVS